jgi:penicillin-binding protein 2
MFENRVKLVLALFVVPALAVAARLFQLQVINGSSYRESTALMLQTRPRQFPCLRGSIKDCRGRLLAYDAPAWDIAVQYGVMVDDPDVRRRMCKMIGFPLAQLSRERIEASWRHVSQLTEKPLPELLQESTRVIGQVRRIKARISELRGVETVVEEELKPHPVVSGLEQAQQVAARVALAEYPWIEVVPSHRRHYEGGTATGHIVGQIGRVSEEDLAGDPNAEDPLACYELDDWRGVRGVEALAERVLRGRRGQIHEDRLGKPISPPVAAVNGADVTLTIDWDLQRALYDRMSAEMTTRLPHSTGGCAVVLEIPSRRVLAMVSYPSVDPNNPEEIVRVREDDVRQPFLFRAVRQLYSPGSIVKPMLLAGALTDGTISSGQTVTCYGHLFPNQPDRMRCTYTHGPMDPISAVQHSCNIFFYQLGEKMTIPAEVTWMSRFGLGSTSGTGLRDELKGRLPTTKTPGEARFAAIGQGELEITPIQAANMAASIATGEHGPVTLWANDPAPRPARVRLPVRNDAWRVVREGMFRAANREGGTAFKNGKLSNPGSHVLLGKTGSAETPPPEWIYLCRLADGTTESRRCTPAALRKYAEEHPLTVVEKTRPPEYDQTHGWFIGYLAPRDRYLEDVRSPTIAIAVIVEYAGHGGEVAVPIAAAMVDSVLMANSGAVAGQGGAP